VKIAYAIALTAMLGAGLNACGVADVVNDLSDAVKNAAEQAKVEDAFDSAVTQVTGQVVSVALEAAGDAMTGATAPYRPQADLGTLEVDQTVNTDDGATVTVKGSISGTASDTESNLQLTLDSTWTGLKAILDDGATVITSGAQALSGSIVSSESAFSINITAKGTMTIDGKSYAFDIALTSDGKTVNYTGAVNGVPVVKTITLPEDQPGNNPNQQPSSGWVCRVDNITGDYCQSFTPGALKEYVTNVCGGTVEAAPCPTATVGTCTTGAGTVNEIVTHYYAGDKEASCTGNGGIWADATP
jgi:hypothetical protein